MPEQYDQKTLKAFIDRRHPEYDTRKEHWEFLESCYSGGREWFKDNIFRYLKEGDKEFEDRLERAYRYNHTREVVDLVSKYIYKAPISRNEEDASEAVVEFWKHSTLNGENIDQYSRQMSDQSSISGRIWVVVDSTMKPGLTIADEKQSEGRIYSYIVSPGAALDMSFDDLGELIWILLYEEERDDADPFTSSGEMMPRFRLWTREGWMLFSLEESENKGEAEVTLIEEGSHGLGVVPVFPVDSITSGESEYSSPSLIGDIAYMDRAVANYLSNLDAIIQDQAFSQLAMPAQGLTPGTGDHDAILDLGTKRIFTYDGENGTQPFYLSPDPKQAELIMGIIQQIINEIYHTVGMAGERTKQDNAMGIDNSSGVAKAYDFERMNALLTSKAGQLERAENRLVELVNLWASKSNKTEENLVSYSDTFDTRDLHDEFDIATRLSLVTAPDEIRRKQMEQVVNKLFPDMAEAGRDRLKKALSEWPEKFETFSTSKEPSIVKESRQGQVTEDKPEDAQETEQS